MEIAIPWINCVRFWWDAIFSPLRFNVFTNFQRSICLVAHNNTTCKCYTRQNFDSYGTIINIAWR